MDGGGFSGDACRPFVAILLRDEAAIETLSVARIFPLENESGTKDASVGPDIRERYDIERVDLHEAVLLSGS